jgi:hypothetical protein
VNIYLKIVFMGFACVTKMYYTVMVGIWQ